MRTVLVADDEFGILLVLEMALSEAGYRVMTAGNGRQALEMATESGVVAARFTNTVVDEVSISVEVDVRY